MNRYEEDDLDALGHFLLIGAVAFLCFCVITFLFWVGWL